TGSRHGHWVVCHPPSSHWHNPRQPLLLNDSKKRGRFKEPNRCFRAFASHLWLSHRPVGRLSIAPGRFNPPLPFKRLSNRPKENPRCSAAGVLYLKPGDDLLSHG